MSRGRVTWLCVLLFVVFGLADYATLVGAEMAETTFDSGIFMRCANRSLLDPAFYSAIRPPTVPFFYKLVGGEPSAVLFVHSLLSVISWFALGLVLASLFSNTALRGIVATLTCAFSLTSPINQWDGVMMSESIFLSLMAATIAVSIFAGRRLLTTGKLNPGLAILWFVVSLLFVGSRDSAVYLFAIPWLSLLVWFVFTKVRKTNRGQRTTGIVSALIAGLVILFAAQVSLHSSQRWHTPLVNVVLKRVLPDAELHQSWMTRYDLPSNAIFEGQVDKFAWNRVPDNIQLRKLLGKSPKLANIEKWLQTVGLSSYQRHLTFDEPVRSVREAIDSLDRSVNPIPPVGPGEREASYSEGAGITSWSQMLTKALYFPLPAPFWVALTVGLGAVLLVFKRSASRAPTVLTVCLIVGVGSQAFITWHGDTAEIARHTLVVGVLLRIAVGCAVAILIDTLMKRESAPV
ncbi:MAG: hypothetical protein ACI8TQ_000361 [Planctomycetota bacterium]|jgi:hypothetical protein